jgi:CubicO group peptidase (beta-lactamase class C family)
MRWITLVVWILTGCASQLPACEPGEAPGELARAAYGGVARAIERGDAPNTTSILVMRAGAIQYEAYFDGADAATLHDVRSTSKSLTALVLGSAISEGLLPGVDARVFDYFPDRSPFEYDGPVKRAITIADLLTMSSAFDCDDDVPSSPGNEEHMYPEADWTRWVLDLPIQKDYARDPSGRGPWHYCTAGTFLLGQVLERATRVPAEAYFTTHLFSPLGITRWKFSRSPTAELMAGGQLQITTRDLARIGWLVLEEGRWQGKQVVDRDWIRQSLTRRRHALLDQEYGYQFWWQTYHHRCGTTDAWFMSGNGGNQVAMFRELGAVVVVTRTHYNQKGMHAQTKALIETEILPELACGDRAQRGSD